VGLESLLTELLVATVLDSVEFETVRVRVHEMVLGEQVGDTVHEGREGKHHQDNNLVIGNLLLAEVSNVLSNVVGHLRGRRRNTIVILDHAVVELRRHSDNHVIVVGVEVTTFRHIVTERSIVVIASQQVVGVVVETGLMSGGLGQLWGPHTLVGLLGLMHGHVGRPDAVIDLALTEVPLLEVVTAVFLMSGMDLGEEHHLALELILRETLVNKQVIFLMHSTVTALARA